MNEPLLPDSSLTAVRPKAPGAGRSGERLRWGLTGLAAIFLIVMIAAAGLRPTGREAKPGTGEPLAVLGVAPGPATRPAEEK
ncbi:hypothetical protein [Sandarakinorhabdus oryzae]|uniref:hypothetical protein n=1 Tax=Sandarakinorhabdus oryzae TaxID=2675220 RepID=UPI001F1A20AB|nr:hypothetical protein [Sandarakinorhabdus oryzae]